MFDRIYILYPRGDRTGGPELLHQACQALRRLGHDARLVPIASTRSMPRSPVYDEYDAPEVLRPVDDDRSAVIAYESAPPSTLRGFRRAHKFLWWLSLDNARLYRGGALRDRMAEERDVLGLRNPVALQRWGARPLSWYESLERRRLRARDDITHLAQSDYAAQRIAVDLRCRPLLLSDYVSVERDDFDNGLRQPDVIAYNPKKGGRLVDLVIERAPRAWRFVPVTGLDQAGVSHLMRSATAYLDMGHQPGRDRMPREAAAAGAPVVLLSRGAAAHDVDCPLPAAYRLPFERGVLDRTVDALAQVLSDPVTAAAEQAGYQSWVRADHARFTDEMLAVFGRARQAPS